MVLHFERFATIFKRDSDSYSRAFKLEFCIAIFGGFRTFYTAMVMVDKIKKHAIFFFFLLSTDAVFCCCSFACKGDCTLFASEV